MSLFENGAFRKVKISLGWIILGVPILLLAAILISVFNVNDPQWAQFMPAKIAQAWVNFCLYTLFILGFELATKGLTVRAITTITEASTSEEKKAAAQFYGLVAIGAAIAISGGF